MGMKARKRGVVMLIARDADADRHSSYVITTSPEDARFDRVYGFWSGIRIVTACPFSWEKTFPQHKLKPGECKRVRVAIEEVE